MPIIIVWVDGWSKWFHSCIMPLIPVINQIEWFTLWVMFDTEVSVLLGHRTWPTWSSVSQHVLLCFCSSGMTRDLFHTPVAMSQRFLPFLLVICRYQCFLWASDIFLAIRCLDGALNCVNSWFHSSSVDRKFIQISHVPSDFVYLC